MTSRAKIAVIQFPGSNTELETIAAIERNGMTPISHLWNEPASNLELCDGYIIVGGFSYEDRSRSGIIASLDPVINTLKKQALVGKPVLGVCNGAQILVESGMVPGNKGFDTIVGLSENKRVRSGQVVGTGYYNTWCYLKSNKESVSAFIDKSDDGLLLQIPIAHAEGRFVMDKKLQEVVESTNLAVYHYCNQDGEIINDFPVNPNGSIDNIAALGNVAGNVMAIMPHPERTYKGDPVFKSLNNFLNSDDVFSYKALRYESKKITISPFKKPKKTTELLISMIIADNEAISVEKCIERLGQTNAGIKKYLHLEIEHDGVLDIENIYETDVLFNPSKEFITTNIDKGSGFRFLVREKENIGGRKMKETLHRRFGFNNITNILKGTVWEINSKEKQIKKDIDLILNSHILCNPISQECHEY
ncbi:MAG: phosphoribosylformylglycinamidine synthase I [Candidatus Marinimicrobia bacterium]|jgi:phosphoribosylformylglycinamidine synthase|nr:phosphoribosylformylglycinamidine synthase I [Candidatus Neomarinimicrobiota bacterium]|tara:strand:- start:2341 stop:3597 length:1257 start_codon:yes stop_codon:yes gene_type:complete